VLFPFTPPRSLSLSLSLSVSFNHAECREWTHLSLEFNSVSLWSLQLGGISDKVYLSRLNNRITNMAKERRLDSAIIAMAT